MTRAKILDAARSEFGEKGYDAASLNAVCRNGGVSKGIIYHYYGSKDGLFLACVEDCFESIIGFLKDNLDEKEDLFENYFNLRMRFFENHQDQARMFMRAAVLPPEKLTLQINEKRENLDHFNRKVFDQIFRQRHIHIREDLDFETVCSAFFRLQDVFHAEFQNSGGKMNIEKYEEYCRTAVSIFLYGIVERKEI